jgi:hypothetical protein
MLQQAYRNYISKQKILAYVHTVLTITCIQSDINILLAYLCPQHMECVLVVPVPYLNTHATRITLTKQQCVCICGVGETQEFVV